MIPRLSLARDPKDAVVALRLLVLAGLSMLGIAEPPEHRALFWLTVAIYGATNLGYLVTRPALFETRRVQLWIFLFDICAVSLLVLARGSSVPEFIVAYFTLVLMAAVAQGLGTALFNAVFVCVLYAAVTLWGRPLEALLTFGVLSQFAFFVVVAIFMGHVATLSRQQALERDRVEAVAVRLEAAVAEKTADLRRSITELEAARSSLLAQERLAALGTISAGIAHEIRNPLAAILAAIEEAPGLLADLEAPRDETVRKDSLRFLRSAWEDSHVACRQLLRVANDLTAVARSAPSTPTSLPCSDVLETASRLLRHRAKDGLRLEVVCTTQRHLLADAGRVQQVLLNLGSNGFDAMEAHGGTLFLSASDGPDGFVRIEVADQGSGMTSEVAARAFDAFFTTKGAGKGTGLGLHLVREIVRAHHATIDFETDAGKGTRFHMLWPAAPLRPATLGESHDHGEREAHLHPAGGRRGDDPPGARADLAAGAV